MSIPLNVCECRHGAVGSGRWYRELGRRAEEACRVCNHPIVDRETVGRLRDQRRESERRAMGRIRKRNWCDLTTMRCERCGVAFEVARRDLHRRKYCSLKCAKNGGEFR